MTYRRLLAFGVAVLPGLLSACRTCDASDQDLILFVRSPRLECDTVEVSSAEHIAAAITAAAARQYGAARATLLDGTHGAERHAIVDRYGNVWVRLQSRSADVLARGCELEVTLADGDTSWHCRLRVRGFPWQPDGCRMGWIVNPQWRSEAR